MCNFESQKFCAECCSDNSANLNSAATHTRGDTPYFFNYNTQFS